MKIAMKFGAALCSALFLAFPGISAAQAYPSKPIRWILAFVPGIGTDIFARRIAPVIAESMGQSIVVENRAGASGAIGAEAAFKAPADGYTILFASSAQTVALAYTTKNLPYDPQGFTPIMVALEPLLVLVMRPSLPANSLKDLIDYAKRNPGKLNYGGTGTGSTFHLFGESLNQAAGINMLHVPYKGSLQAVNDIMGGSLDMSFGTLAGIGPLISAGKLRAIAVLAEKRSHVTPDLPTAGEVVPGLDVLPGWFSFWGPPGLPQPIARRLNGELLKSMSTPESRGWFDANGFVYIGSTPEELAGYQRRGMESYGRVVKMLGIKAE